MPDLFISPSKIKTPEEEKNPPLSNKSGLDMISKETHTHSLSSFCQNPKGFSFKDQEPDEEMLLFLRAHFITNLPWIVISALLILLPFVFFAFPFLSSLLTFPQNFIFILIGFYYLIVFSYIFINFITWFYNIGIITNRRVIDIDYSDIVYHHVAMTKLNLVEDVSYIQSGFIRSLFGYGDIFIQTAGEKSNFDFLAVPEPEKATGIIEDLIGGPR